MVIRSLDHPSKITRECKDNNLMGAHHPAILCVLEPKGVVCEEGKIELGFFMQQSDSQTNADLTKPCCVLQSFYSENIRIYLLVTLNSLIERTEFLCFAHYFVKHLPESQKKGGKAVLLTLDSHISR